MRDALRDVPNGRGIVMGTKLAGALYLADPKHRGREAGTWVRWLSAIAVYHCAAQAYQRNGTRRYRTCCAYSR